MRMLNASRWTLLVTLLCAPAVAEAHAFLEHAEPKVGSTVDASPKEVKVFFTEEVEPAFSTLRVLDGGEHELDKKDTHVDGDNQKLLIVTVPPLPPGTYKVEWKVVASDTHHTQGSFTFTVKE